MTKQPSMISFMRMVLLLLLILRTLDADESFSDTNLQSFYNPDAGNWGYWGYYVDAIVGWAMVAGKSNDVMIYKSKMSGLGFESTPASVFSGRYPASFCGTEFIAMSSMWDSDGSDYFFSINIYGLDAATNTWTNSTPVATIPSAGTAKFDSSSKFACTGDKIAVLRMVDSSSSEGAKSSEVLVYERDKTSNIWSTSASSSIDVSPSSANGEMRSIAMSDQNILLSSLRRFAVFMYELTSSGSAAGEQQWNRVASYLSTKTGYHFGGGTSSPSLAMTEKYAVVAGGGDSPGAIIIERNAVTRKWNKNALQITATSNNFGKSVAITDKVIAIGVDGISLLWQPSDNYVAVYSYIEREKRWDNENAHKINYGGPIEKGSFGGAVAIGGMYLIVGEWHGNAAWVYSGNCSRGYNLQPSGCKACPVGMFAQESGICNPCGVGKFTTETASLECRSCLPGRYADATGSSECTGCPPGKYGTAIGGHRESDCLPCVAGSYSFAPGAGSCVPCSSGTYSAAASSLCGMCPANTYTHLDGLSACTPCPEGTVSSEGSHICRPKVLCTSGQSSKSGYAPCDICPAGRAQHSSGATECGECEAGTYSAAAGSALCQVCGVGRYAPRGNFACSECPADMVPSEQGDKCVLCGENEYVSGGQCLKEAVLSGNDNALKGVLANNGTPFYIMAILVVLLGAVGYAIHGAKKSAKEASVVLQLPETLHVFQFVSNSLGLISELILSLAIMTSGRSDLMGFAVMLFLSRFLLSTPPGALLVYDIFSGHHQEVEDEDEGGNEDVAGVNSGEGRRSLKYYLADEVVVHNSKLFTALLILGLVEPSLLCFFPWYHTPFSAVAKFPTAKYMMLCFGCKMLQLVVTLIAQICIMAVTSGASSSGSRESTFSAIVIMNLCLTCILFLVKGSEMFLRYGTLRGSKKDTDCDAAKAAWRQVQKDRRERRAMKMKRKSAAGGAGAGAGAGLELTDIYDTIGVGGGETENPMLTASATAPSPSAQLAPPEEVEGPSSSLLASYVTQEQMTSLERRLDEHMRAIREELARTVASASVSGTASTGTETGAGVGSRAGAEDNI